MMSRVGVGGWRGMSESGAAKRLWCRENTSFCSFFLNKKKIKKNREKNGQKYITL